MDNGLRQFLVGKYVVESIQAIRNKTRKEYSPEELDNLVEAIRSEAEIVKDTTTLAKKIPDGCEIAKFFSDLDSVNVTHEEYEVSELVTTFWVSDLPHEVTHKSLAEIVEFADKSENRKSAPKFFKTIDLFRQVPGMLSLPGIVCTPTYKQRAKRWLHDIDCNDPSKGQFPLRDFVPGRAYIENGTHRTVASLLESKETTIWLPTFHWK